MSKQSKTSGLGRLSGRKILVTGAASGIGLATAELFLMEGASVAMLDIQTNKLEIEAKKCGGIPISVDVRDSESVSKAIEQSAEQLGGIDGLVNGAGFVSQSPIEEFPIDEWEKVIAVNLVGPFLVCRAAVPWLKKQGGTIVNIASGAGILPSGPNGTAYSGSKGGLIAFSKALAIELAPNIRVNSLCPGLTKTPMTAFIFEPENEGLLSIDDYALKRAAEPMEIARACLFLMTEESSFITGSTLVADGGRSFH